MGLRDMWDGRDQDLVLGFSCLIMGFMLAVLVGILVNMVTPACPGIRARGEECKKQLSSCLYEQAQRKVKRERFRK